MSRKKYKSKLSGSVTMQLIETVKEHPCLWNPSNSAYHNRLTIYQTWEKISGKINIPADTLKAKWKNLRDTYVKIIKMCKTPDDYTGQWRYFKHLNYIYRPCDEQSEDSDENGFETLYDDETPLNEVGVKVELEAASSEYTDPIDTDLIESVTEKGIKAEDTDDYDLMFLKSLAPYFKKLDMMRKLVVRSKIQDMLMNELAAQNSEGFKRIMGDV